MAGYALASSHPVKRWYTDENVTRGAVVFAENCAVCHGANGEGTADWRTLTEDGRLPPPPLNGTAHTWHHPIRVLGSQIKFGTPGDMGTMPGFADKLSDQEIVDVIAWFQSLWPDPVYAQWREIEARSK